LNDGAVDLAVSAEQESFLAGFRAYLDGLDLDLDEVRRTFETDPMEIVGPAREFVRRLGRDGWLGMGWPAEYGGGGRSAVEQWLFLEELAYGALAVREMTCAHVRQRHQFGVPLSSFQAVQHLVADMATHVEAGLLASWPDWPTPPGAGTWLSRRPWRRSWRAGRTCGR
jgi:alkylation response protein AidB-like acyl-CoA dehydrogenase